MCYMQILANVSKLKDNGMTIVFSHVESKFNAFLFECGVTQQGLNYWLAGLFGSSVHFIYTKGCLWKMRLLQLLTKIVLYNLWGEKLWNDGKCFAEVKRFWKKQPFTAFQKLLHCSINKNAHLSLTGAPVLLVQQIKLLYQIVTMYTPPVSLPQQTIPSCPNTCKRNSSLLSVHHIVLVYLFIFALYLVW